MRKLKVAGFLQFGQAVLLKCRVVIGVEAIHTQYFVATRKQFLGGVHADKAGGTREHDFHGASFF